MELKQNQSVFVFFLDFSDRQGWLVFWYLKSEMKAERGECSLA